MFDDEDIDGVKLRSGGIASVKPGRYPSIKDIRKFQNYVKKNNAWDLFQRRIAPKAYFDRLENGESVPGVSIFEKSKITIKGTRGE